jgi:response regulator RpfG family c-di-GMP phosphodiesterase
MNERILLVDDEPLILEVFQRGLSERFTVDTAPGGKEALGLLRTRGPYAVVLADMTMPGMPGVELLEHVRALSPDTVRMMLTGNIDQKVAVAAVNRGQVSQFLNKPAGLDVLVPALEAGLDEYARKLQDRELFESTLVGSVSLLTDVLGMVARDALGRGQRLRDAMGRFAEYLGAPSRWELELGALLSSVGLTAVPSGILRKIAASDPLTPEEEMVMERVPRIGRDLLVAIPRFSDVAEIVFYQRKNFDGSGFPADGIAGEVIPLGARILAILHDRFDLEEAGVETARVKETMSARTGRYDPVLLKRCFKCFPDLLIPAVSSSRPVTPLPATDLRPGDIVASDLMTKGGVTLVSAGTILSAMMIARLENFRILHELQEPLLIQRGGTD